MGLKPEDLERGAVYRRAWLLSQGMHSRHLYSSALVRVLPGCFTRADHPASLRRVVLAAQELVGVPSAASGATAAVVFGIRLPHRATRAGRAAVHLDVEDGSTPRRTPLLVIHRRVSARTLRLHGVTMVEPLVALRQIAGRLTHEELVVALDSLVADRFGTVTRLELDEVRRWVEQARGHGAARLRAAADDARERVWSTRETQMHLLLRRHGQPPPVLNHQVLDPVTGTAYFVDLAYPRERIAIEYDGVEHLTDADRVKRDHRKSAVLHAEGWTVLRVYAEDLHDLTDLLARLAHAFRAATTAVAVHPLRAPIAVTAAPHVVERIAERPLVGGTRRARPR